MRSACKYVLLIVLFCETLLISGFISHNSLKPKKTQWVIVIDPGHGGKDPGCSGKKWKEKNVALAVSLKFGHFIETNDKDVKVVYTRTTDQFVGLNERAEIANKIHADLFICIHCNASPNHEAFGAATYVMGLKKSGGNLEVEKRENSSILYEKDYKTTYSGFDPDSPEANIVFAMYQNIFLTQSLNLAGKIQNEYAHIAKRKDNEVKQAGFLVLWKTAMPSLLTEIGFLTNPEEEKFLGTQKGEDEIAKSIFLAFQQYKAEKDGSNYDPKVFNFTSLIVQNPDSAQTDSTQKNNISPDTASVNKKACVIKDSVTAKKDSVKTVSPHIKKDSAKKHTAKTEYTTVKDSAQAKINKMKEAIKAMKHDSAAHVIKATDTVVTHKKIAIEEDTGKAVYKVQIVVSDHEISLQDKRFDGLPDVGMYTDTKIYKYTAGHFYNLQDAIDLQKKLRGKGFKDAFVVAFKGGKRVTIKKAEK